MQALGIITYVFDIIELQIIAYKNTHDTTAFLSPRLEIQKLILGIIKAEFIAVLDTVRCRTP